MSDIRFESWRHKDKRKQTEYWGIFLKDTNATKMGEVEWNNKVKSFVFVPVIDGLYGPQCLEEIIVFLKNANFLHKEKQKKQRKTNRILNGPKS